MALAYARAVAERRTPACRFVILACERYLRMLTPAWQQKHGIYFSNEHAIEACAFIETLHHWEGEWAGRPFMIEPWQMWIVCAIYGFRWESDGLRVVTTVYAEIPRKHGKAEWIENRIPTTLGMKRMGDLQVGDFVFSADGSPTPIVAVTEEMVGRPCLEVEFASGEKIVVDENHEWLTEPRHMGPRALNKRQPRDLWWNAAETARVFETKEIAKTLTCGGRGDNNHFVPVACALQMPDAELPIDPYVLGAWLGDGSSRVAQITCDDQGILDRIEAAGEPVAKLTGPYQWAIGERQRSRPEETLGGRLRALGLTLNKHVPEVYFLASERQRRHLLQGLMDTDGCAMVATNGLARCEFTTTSPRLRSDVVRLVASLGMKPTVSEGRATLRGVDCGPKWRVSFTAYREDAPFGLTRKLDRLSPRPAKRTRAGTRAIVAVRPAGNRTTRCIQVAHPSHLYLTGHSCIPTHNSLLASAIGLYETTVAANKGDHLYIIAPKLDQGLKVLKPLQQMVALNPHLQNHFGIHSTKKTSEVRGTNSDIIVLSSIGEKQDGHNPKIVIADEFHAVPDDLFNVMQSAQRARSESLFLMIGSAGRHTFGTGWNQRRHNIDMLEGRRGEEEWVFAAIYTVDPGDDRLWDKEETVVKASPGIGVSVNLRKTMQDVAGAKGDPSKKSEFLRTALNLWGFGENVLFPQEKWERASYPGMRMEQCMGLRCWVGLDLASRNDMVAMAVLFERETGELVSTDAGLVADVDLFAFARHFVPKLGPWVEDEDLAGPYRAWNETEHLTMTPGSRHDYGQLRRELFALFDAGYDIQAVVIDDQQANEFFAALQDAGKPVVAYRKNASNHSDPTKDLMSRVNGEEQSLFHDGNPVLAWNMANVIGGTNTAGLILGKKPTANSTMKIDGFDALVQANAARLQMVEIKQPRGPNPMAVRGMRIL